MAVPKTILSRHLQDLEGVIELQTQTQHADTLVVEAVVVEVEMHQSVVEF